MVLILPAFADDSTLLAMPLYSKVPTFGIPVLVESTLMYIGASDAFRINKSLLAVAVGTLDADGITKIAKCMYSATCGEQRKISIPRATMTPEYIGRPEHNPDKFGETINEGQGDEKSQGKSRYTILDYQYVTKNYPDNIDEIIIKYGLKNKASVYRLRHYLQKRYASGVVTNEEVSESPRERQGGGGA